METSAALGFGFRCGFLGLLHLEVIRDRIEREYDIELITTAPSVIYHVYMKDGEMIELHNPADMPDPSKVDHIEEPRIKATILVPGRIPGRRTETLPGPPRHPDGPDLCGQPCDGCL